VSVQGEVLCVVSRSVSRVLGLHVANITPLLVSNQVLLCEQGMERRFQRVKQDSVFYKTRVCHR